MTTQEPEFTATHLLENGLEALRSGATMVRADASDRDLRIAMREVSSGVELVLKGILAAEHWSLVFDSPKQASLDSFRRGTFRSAGFDDCIQRLSNIANIPMDPDRKDHLSRMRDKRNRLEHLGICDNLYALRASIGGALHAIANVLRDAGRLGLLDDTYESLPTDLAVEFSEIDAFVDARWKALSLHIKRGDGDLCPACNQRAASVDDGLKCLFCETHTAATDAADHFLETERHRSAYDTIKDGGDWPRHECPECDQDAMVETAEEPERFRCFSCDATFSGNDLTWCSQCNKPFISPDGFSICPDCFTYMVNRD